MVERRRTLSAGDRDRGTNQSSLRQYNERLALSLIRRTGPLPKAEIARATGLTAQTISVIMNRLEADGLISRCAPLRGRVGQPSVPYALNPEGAFSLGLKVGRRSFDLSLVDFTGALRATLRETFAWPTPERLLDFTRKGVAELTAGLSPESRRRICGLGVATPYEIWSWSEETGAPPEAMAGWRDFDLARELGAVSGVAVHVCNDATAACAAELVFGNPGRHADFLHIYIGAFVGGGVVLDGSLFVGPSGNAGAIGSLPMPGRGNGAVTRQLVAAASKLSLERKLLAAGRDAAALWQAGAPWRGFDAELAAWIEEVADALAFAIVSAISVIDFPIVILDGAMPPEVRERLVAATAGRVAGHDLKGLSPVAVIAGTLGTEARTLGSAGLPLLADYAADSAVLFKSPG